MHSARSSHRSCIYIQRVCEKTDARRKIYIPLCRRDFDAVCPSGIPKQYTPPSHSRCASVAGSLLQLLAWGGFTTQKQHSVVFLLATIARGDSRTKCTKYLRSGRGEFLPPPTPPYVPFGIRRFGSLSHTDSTLLLFVL